MRLVVLLLASVAHSAVTVPSVWVPERVTVATTWNTVTFPEGTQYLLIRSEGQEGYWTTGCTDAAALGSDYATLSANTDYTLAVHEIKHDGGLCVAGVAAGTMQLTPLRRGK